MADFTISHEEALAAIGDRGFKKIIKLSRVVRNLPAEIADAEVTAAMSFRLAPSIMTRSEAELLGTSMPRFAVRIYLDEKKTSFINARRMREFAMRVSGFTWQPLAAPIIGSDGELYVDVSVVPGGNPIDEMLTNNCIGDSVLSAHDELRRQYHILEADLGTPYGEGERIRATPFLNPIKCPGGGLCAQACCFMASALLHDYPLIRLNDTTRPSKNFDNQSFIGVHGVAEITAIVAGEGLERLRLKGLSWAHIILYFEKVGRVAASQRLNRRRFGQSDGLPFFREALRAYVMSGFPVILPTCFSSIKAWYDAQELKTKSQQMGAEDRPILVDSSVDQQLEDHAIILVGCGRQDSDEFLFNDPAKTPFRGVRFEQLLKFCPKLTPNRKMPLLLPVTPAEIKMSLETRYIRRPGDERGTERPGLFDVANLLQRAHDQWKNRLYPQLPTSAPYAPGHFQLIRTGPSVGRLPCPSAASGHGHVDETPQILPPDDRIDAELIDAWRQLAPWQGQWCWMQYRQPVQNLEDASIWIWDAQFEFDWKPWWSSGKAAVYPIFIPPWVFEAAEAALIAVFVKSPSGQWMTRFLAPSPFPPSAQARGVSRRSADHQKPINPSVKVSLISSFASKGGHDAAAHWPRSAGPDACEFYAFMHPDSHVAHFDQVDVLLPDGRREKICPSALQLMASIEARFESDPNAAQHEIVDLAKKVSASFAQPSVNAPIVALASYLPEISSRTPRQAVRAVSFLIRFARALRLIDAGAANPRNPIGVIELVAGSRIEGISKTQALKSGGADYVYFAHRTSTEQAVDSLCKNLREAVRLTELVPEEGIYLALELEPGPLYVLNGLGSMELVNHYLQLYELSQVVGFNLDIAHFALAGITPRHLRDSKWRHLLDRIVHAHVSDHGQGHFGDLAIGQAGFGQSETPVGRLGVFKEWLELVEQLAVSRREPGSLPFSGYISVELEAARNAALVADSLVSLRHLL